MNKEKLILVITDLLKSGTKLQEIQKILKDEHKYNITFMNLRLLSADIEIDWKNFDPKKEKVKEKIKPIPDVVNELEISKSSIVRPGAVVNGTFNAPSGAYGEWIVSSMGQLEIDYGDDKIHLTAEESQEFQTKLREILSN